MAVQPDVGILVSNTSGNNVIGGTTDAARNILSGFKVAINLFAAQSQFNEVPGSLIQGNYVGTDASGTVVLGNGVGIYVNGVPLNTIGGTTAGARNVISGNQTGIYVFGSTATRNVIRATTSASTPRARSPKATTSGSPSTPPRRTRSPATSSRATSSSGRTDRSAST